MPIKIPTTTMIIRAALAAVLIPAGLAAQGFRTEHVEGRLHFGVGAYNRIEGLPLQIGPVIQTRWRYPLRFTGILVARTETDPLSDFEQFGFLSAIEKDFGEHVVVGVSGWSRLKSIEDRGLTDVENTLSAFVFHEDRRDYFDALGIGVHARFRALSQRLTGSLGFRHERLYAVGPQGASTIFDNGTPWREQPLAAQGGQHTSVATLVWDDRPLERDGPFNGWFASLDVLIGLGGSLEYPTVDDQFGNPVNNFLVPNAEVIRIIGDVRKYFALSDVEINLRATGGGSLNDRPMPTQYQAALGGSGTMLGLPSFSLDCGARESIVVPTANELRDPFTPYYGCDRHVLLQAEIAGYFGFAIGSEQTRRNAFRSSGGLGIRLVPQWVIFADAGQGWSHLEGFYPTVRDETMRYDVGGGIVFGNLGVYAAYPIDDPNPKFRFAARLIRRF